MAQSKEQKAAYYQRNKERLNEMSKQRQQKNKDKKREYDKQYNIKNKARLAKQHAEYQKENREAVNAKNNKYYYRNHEKIKNRKRSQLPKVIKYKRKHNQTHKLHYKNYQLVRNYNITLEDFNKIKESQDNCCAICGKHESNFKKGLAVDHCHTTGKIRGLLCGGCNTSLGRFNDDINMLNKAIQYLQKETPPIKAEFFENDFII